MGRLKSKHKIRSHIIYTQRICIKCGRSFDLRVEGDTCDDDPVCGVCFVAEGVSGVDEGGFLDNNETDVPECEI